MSLAVGENLGAYEILAPLGTGGMGEVYRARDTKLERDVAIKVMPAALARDPERLARFEREAKVLASLNHPNIAQIYGVEESGGVRALVMELVPGAPLKTPLALEVSLQYARQIADALEAAHDKGIIHRDLKPANIMVTPEGVIKVLDFGLAAVAQTSSSSGMPENSPTITMAATQAGVIMGTAAYMSPEQAAGKPVDKRADIWSYGVVLWEMLTGARLFDGETVSHTLADVLRAAIDFDKLPATTPRVIRDLVKRCLDRDVKTRLRDIGEARVVIQKYLADPDSDVDVGAAGSTRLKAGASAKFAKLWPTATALFALGFVALAFLHFRETPPPEQTIRSTISAPENSTVHSFAISPDGRTLVIAARVNGKQQLWLRPMDALRFQPMAFTEEATYPFWSPDNRYIGFFAQGKLKKIAASGGPAQSLCDAVNGQGGSWNRDDVIVFSPISSGVSIQRISANGGSPIDVTKTKGDQRFPVFLPGGSHFLYEASGVAETTGIYVSSLDGRENRHVLPDASGAVFAPSSRGERTGQLLFVRENTLMAAPFDPVSAQISGDGVPMSVGVPLSYRYLPVTVSDNGVLLYAAGGSAGQQNQFAWFDRAGKFLGPVGMPGGVHWPAISPDERSVAFSRTSSGGNDIWVRDLSRGTETRFTSDAASNFVPFWSPKGERIVFASNRTGVFNLYQKAASGSGQDELLLANRVINTPTQWSWDGRFIVYYEIDPKTKHDLWVLPTEGAALDNKADRKPIPFLKTEATEIFGQLSPDSHWMAFTSDRSGKREVYVRPFRFPEGASEGEWTISLAGGEMPRWRRDGKELFFEAADGKMMAVSVKAVTGAKSSFEAGAPLPLFDAHMVHQGNDVNFEYDVTADGKRFLINTIGGPGAASAPPLTVVTNWQAGLKK